MMRHLSLVQCRKSRRQKTITDTKSIPGGQFTGAPELSRDIFVFRVSKYTNAEVILASRSVNKLSKDEAKFASFKVEICLSDMQKVLDPIVWSFGNCMRRFFKRRSDQNYS